MKVDSFGDLSEYVENQSGVLEILSKFDFDIKFKGMKIVNDTNMYNYDFIIKNIETGTERAFDYSERHWY